MEKDRETKEILKLLNLIIDPFPPIRKEARRTFQKLINNRKLDELNKKVRANILTTINDGFLSGEYSEQSAAVYLTRLFNLNSEIVNVILFVIHLSDEVREEVEKTLNLWGYKNADEALQNLDKEQTKTFLKKINDYAFEYDPYAFEYDPLGKLSRKEVFGIISAEYIGKVGTPYHLYCLLRSLVVEPTDKVRLTALKSLDELIKRIEAPLNKLPYEEQEVIKNRIKLNFTPPTNQSKADASRFYRIGTCYFVEKLGLMEEFFPEIINLCGDMNPDVRKTAREVIDNLVKTKKTLSDEQKKEVLKLIRKWAGENKFHLLEGIAYLYGLIGNKEENILFLKEIDTEVQRNYHYFSKKQQRLYENLLNVINTSIERIENRISTTPSNLGFETKKKKLKRRSSGRRQPLL